MMMLAKAKLWKTIQSFDVALIKAIPVRLLFLLCLCTVARGADNWPDTFKIVCGDILHKVPYDPSDEAGTLANMAFSGEASRTPADKLAGYYTGGLGYTITATVTEEKLTGMPTALSVTFQCGTRDLTDTTQNKLTCSSSLRSLSAVPGFNAISASLPAPGKATLGPKSQMAATLSVRRQESDRTPSSSVQRYYQSIREMVCIYSR